MDLDRIERALREGPPDEPIYVPGAFRGSDRPVAWLMFVGVAVGLALVLGVAIGAGLAGLRADRIGGPRPPALSSEDLRGTWSTSPISLQAWIDGASARGYDMTAIYAFLGHDPIQREVRYTLEFVPSDALADHLTIKAEYDGAPIETLSGGTFAVEGDGVLHYTEVVPGSTGAHCQVFLPAVIEGDQLTLRIESMQDCDPEQQLAHGAFFELSPYQRVGS